MPSPFPSHIVPPDIGGRHPTGTHASLYAALLALLLLVPIPTAAIQLGPSFELDRWTLEDGLPGQALEDIARHGDGYLWLVASGFLVRFDGVRFHVFRPEAHPGLPGDRIVGLAVAPGDTVWATTTAGHLVRYAGGTFQVVGRTPTAAWSVAAPGGGRVWVRTSPEVWIRDGDGLRPVATLERWGISEGGGPLRPQLVADGEGAWVRESDRREVVRIAPDGTELTRWPTRATVLATTSLGSDVVVDTGADTVIELRVPQGLLQARFPRGPPERLKPERDRRLPRLVDRHGRVWASHEGSVEVYLPGATGPDQSFDLGAGTRVVRMIEDAEGSVWIATTASGLMRVREVPFRTVGGPGTGFRASQILRIFPDGPDAVVAVDRSYAAHRIRNGRVVERLDTELPGASSGPPSVAAVLTDRRGTTWVARARPPAAGEQGDRPAWELRGQRDGEPDLVLGLAGSVRALTEDPAEPGTLWASFFSSPGDPAGTTGAPPPCGGRRDGCVRRIRPYEPGGPEHRDFLPGWGARLAPDGDGGVWATEGRRLAHVDRAGRVRVWPPPSTVEMELRGLHPDGDGGVWVGSYGSGLLHFRQGSWGVLREADGLAEDVVSTILEDDEGNLWMGGNRGVHRVARSQARAFLDGTTTRVDGVAYGARSGLDGPEGSGSHGVRDGAGRLWFPTFGGAAVVEPARALALDAAVPRVRVESVRGADGEEVPRDPQGGARLEKGVRTFEIDFTATSLRDPEALRFEYRLEGADDEWVPASGTRTVRYTNVPAGEHTFRVRARTAGGVWSEADATVELAVPPFFHETPWFVVLLTAGVAAGILFTIRIRERTIQARAAELSRQVEERTWDLEAERRHTAETLEVVRDQATRLRALDEAKSRFFANVTHELRTPLTLLLGPLADLEAGRRGPLPDAAIRDLELARTSSERLLELVDQLLDIARLEAGEMELRPTRGDTAAVLSRVTAAFEAHARRRGIAYEVVLPQAPTPASFDSDALAKITSNLLGNAFKFTPEGETVRVRARTEEERGAAATLVLEVEDTGRGIRASELDRVFDRFHRTDETGAPPTHGTGVGLSLVRELVELHGGQVEVRSAEGAGSTFTVRLPLSPAPGSDTASASPPGAAPAEGATPGVLPVRPSPPDVNAAPAGDGDELVALVVEDHAELRRWIRERLEPCYRVLEAGDGDTALAMARAHLPDVVVSDIMMPGMDGETLCETLKSDPETDFIPVILLTARSTRGDRLSGLRRGADAYLTKPFDPEELLLTLKNAVDVRRALREQAVARLAGLPAAEPPWEETAEDELGRSFLDHLYRTLAGHLSNEDLTVEGVAEAMGMSRSTLYRRVEENLAQPPMEVIWAYRLEQAAEWLRSSDATVTEVAYGVGFKTVPHFSRRFKDRFGVSPTTWRDG